MGLWAPMMLPHHRARSIYPAPRLLPLASLGWAPPAVFGSFAHRAMVTCPPAGWSSSMSFAETSARASCLAPVRRAIPLPSPGDARSLVRGAKTRTRPAQLSISRPRRPGHSAGALGVVDARASKATAHGEAAHHALSGCRSAEPPACHLGAQHHPRAQPPVKGRTVHPI